MNLFHPVEVMSGFSAFEPHNPQVPSSPLGHRGGQRVVTGPGTPRDDAQFQYLMQSGWSTPLLPPQLTQKPPLATTVRQIASSSPLLIGAIMQANPEQAPVALMPSVFGSAGESSVNLTRKRDRSRARQDEFASSPSSSGSLGQAPPLFDLLSLPSDASVHSDDVAVAPERPRRKAASNGVIACCQCRARKIKCDSVRPICGNCFRRGGPCVFDLVPKRRGPDKRPGTRQRSCKKKAQVMSTDDEAASVPTRKRRKVSNDQPLLTLNMSEGTQSDRASTELLSPQGSIPEGGIGVDVVREMLPGGFLGTSIRENTTIVSDAIYPKAHQDGILSLPPPSQSPVYQYPTDLSHPMHSSSPLTEDSSILSTRQLSPLDARQTWWDNLLMLYSLNRDEAMLAVFDDLEFLMKSSDTWLFFLDPVMFLSDVRDQEQRERMQPSLILSALAASVLIRSSQAELGTRGRHRALTFRNMAQGYLQDSVNRQAYDYTLAEAAVILAFFESCMHPEYDPDRAVKALQQMDDIIHRMGLSKLDSSHPNVCIWNLGEAPGVHTWQKYSERSCRCTNPAEIPQNADPNDYSLGYIPPLNRSWPVEEIRREECRRIVWAAVDLIANYTARCSAFKQDPVPLRLAEASNITVLFPGEIHERQSENMIPNRDPKDSVWALYCRTLLMWNAISSPERGRMHDKDLNDYCFGATQHLNLIEEGLDMHRCNLDTKLMFVAREYLYNCRMTVNWDIRRSMKLVFSNTPKLTKEQGEEWVQYQSQVMDRVRESILSYNGHGRSLTRQPWSVLWFSGQLNLCLALWEWDMRTHRSALELGKTCLLACDAFNILWPCAAQKRVIDEYRKSLEDYCLAAGILPPLPPDMELPAALTSLRMLGL